ncbi:MAG: recombination mediator RecR [Salibacteraceae bacterium]
MELPSKLLEKAVEHFESLPGVGRKTALRYALQVLRMGKTDAVAFGQSICQMANELKFCSRCHNISDDTLCSVCAHPKRDQNTICVVEDLRDLLAIENTGQFRGTYHVLGGVINPLEGISPADLNIESLINRIKQENTAEIIFALPATMEGDTTCFYIFKKVEGMGLKITSLARGVAVGNELQYTDEVTLGRSIAARQPYDVILKGA